MADGTYISHDHCLLVCCDGMSGNVLAWRWCRQKNSREYAASFTLITREYGQPLLLVSDGMRGIGKAARTAWPSCRLQRCLVHVQQDCRTSLTLHPRTQPGRELQKIVSLLPRVHSIPAARLFFTALNTWYGKWRGWLAEKTTYIPQVDGIPMGKPYKDWTHKRVRCCYKRLARLSHSSELFSFLDPKLIAACSIGAHPRTSNRLEGGINVPIKRMLVFNRGMPEKHMLRACEWMCWKHSERSLPPIKSMLKQAKPISPRDDEDYLPGWGTGIQ